MKDVAVIIINYNTAKYTLECIASVQQHTEPSISYEIIVVDNASQASDYQLLANNFPSEEHISLHRSDVNTGFGGGNMIGASLAHARYLLFLNNDALLLNDCLGLLHHYMEANTQVGVCTAQNYDEHENHVPSFDHDKGLRRLLLGRSFLEKNWPKKYPKRKKVYTEPLEVNWVNGAFMFFRRSAFNKVDGFDTAIFLYFEEMDICFRLRKAGYISTLVPQAKILHYQGVSIGKSKAVNKEAYISYLHVVRKNYSTVKYLLIKWYLVLVLTLKPKKRYLVSTIMKGRKAQKDSLRYGSGPVTN